MAAQASASKARNAPKKLFELSDKELAGINDAKFLSELNLLTVRQASRFKDLRSLSPSQKKMIDAFVHRRSKRDRRDVILKMRNASDANETNDSLTTEQQSSKPSFWQALFDWFMSFDPGALVRRRNTPRPKRKKGGKQPEKKSLGLRRRVPLDDQVKICEGVYGENCLLPGGAGRTLFICEPFRLTEDMNVLDMNAGLGGPGEAIAKKHGCSVSFMEPNAEIAQTAAKRMSARAFADRVQILGYDADALKMPNKKFDRVIAREMMFKIADKAAFLDKTQANMRAGGQIVITDLALDDNANPESAALKMWRETEGSQIHPLTVTEYRNLLKDVNMEIHGFDDDTLQYAQSIRRAWAEYVSTMHERETSSEFQQHVLCEAEYWHSRLRAFEAGDLKLLRLRAIRHSSRFIRDE